MSAKNKHRSTNDYLKYLKGELSGQERHAFERGLEADPFEREAMEGLESLRVGQAEEDLLALHNRLRKRVLRKRRVALYSVAATVASLLIVGTVFLKIHDFDPRSQEKQAYPEESYENFVPEKAESLPVPIEEKQDATPEIQKESRSADKGPDKALTVQEPEADAAEVHDFVMDEEPGVEMEVSRMAAPLPEAEEIQEEEIQEEEIQEEKIQEEKITYMEAEPEARADEAITARAEKSGRKKMKSVAQPGAVQVQETPEMALSQKELEDMLTGKVTGIVISAEDQGPIPGAVVVNRELNSGVTTDLDGRFGIPVQEDSPTTLVASFIGMETKEYQVEDGAHLEVLMQPDVSTLDEVVVVGYVSGQEIQPSGSAFDFFQAEEEKGVEFNVPEPSTGFKDYRKYIEENIRHPQELGTNKEVVVLKFTVTKAGVIEDVIALRSPGASFTEEAIRLLMDGPAWNPASNEDGTRDESVRIRFVFKK